MIECVALLQSLVLDIRHGARGHEENLIDHDA